MATLAVTCFGPWYQPCALLRTRQGVIILIHHENCSYQVADCDVRTSSRTPDPWSHARPHHAPDEPIRLWAMAETVRISRPVGSSGTAFQRGPSSPFRYRDALLCCC